VPYIDFAQLKEEYTIEEVADRLGLKLRKSQHQLRGTCPACEKGGDRALAITPNKGMFYCFAASQGGDLISLAAHVMGCSVKEAAQFIAGNQVQHSPPTSPKSGEVEEGGKTLEPLSYLQADHPAVEAVGFDQETAEALGIGYAPKGIMRGLVAVPMRLEDGTLAGYIGISEARLPKHFFISQTTNVVPLKRPA